MPPRAGDQTPEWDWRHQRTAARLLRAAVRGGPHWRTLSPPARICKLRPAACADVWGIVQTAPRWHKAQVSGDEIDIDAWVRFQSETAAAPSSDTPGVRHRQQTERSLAALLLADLSLSTDAYAASNARVIDVIREALYVLAQHGHGRRF